MVDLRSPPRRTPGRHDGDVTARERQRRGRVGGAGLVVDAADGLRDGLHSPVPDVDERIGRVVAGEHDRRFRSSHHRHVPGPILRPHDQLTGRSRHEPAAGGASRPRRARPRDDRSGSTIAGARQASGLDPGGPVARRPGDGAGQASGSDGAQSEAGCPEADDRTDAVEDDPVARDRRTASPGVTELEKQTLATIPVTELEGRGRGVSVPVRPVSAIRAAPEPPTVPAAEGHAHGRLRHVPGTAGDAGRGRASAAQGRAAAAEDVAIDPDARDADLSDLPERPGGPATRQRRMCAVPARHPQRVGAERRVVAGHLMPHVR